MSVVRRGNDRPPVLAPDANRGQVVVVTGGGTGIGRATALAFAATGADLAICGRRPEPLEATRREVEEAGARCLALPCDIRETDQSAVLVAAVLERYETVDVLVNNAGGQFTAPAEDISLRGFRAVHRLAVDAAWDLTQRFASSAMIPSGRGGLIVFVGFSPRRGIPGYVHASSARAAVENLASGLAIEWAKYRIRAVAVAAGNIATEGLESYGEAEVEAARRQVPLGRLGAPEEVAEVIAFLASAGGAYISGSTILVDGGLDAWGQGEPPPLPQ